MARTLFWIDHAWRRAHVEQGHHVGGGLGLEVGRLEAIYTIHLFEVTSAILGVVVGATEGLGVEQSDVAVDGARFQHGATFLGNVATAVRAPVGYFRLATIGGVFDLLIFLAKGLVLHGLGTWHVRMIVERKRGTTHETNPT